MPHECTNCGYTFPDGSKEMLSGCPDCGGNKFQFAPTASGSSDRTDQTATPDSTQATASQSGRRTVESDTPDSEPESSVTARADETGREWAGTDAAEATDAGEFDEWPETARRPEDRSPEESTESPSTESPTSSTQSPDASTHHASGSSTSSSPDPSTPPSADSPSTRSSATVQSGTAEDAAQADARSDVVSKDDLPSESSGAETPPDHGRVVSEPTEEQPSIDELRAELNEQFESIKIVSPGQYELNLMELYNREEHIISLQEDGRYVINVPDSWHNDGGD